MTDAKTFLDHYLREHATTRKVLAAYPAEQAGLKPAEKSNSAMMLAWTIYVEERLMLFAIRNESVLGGGFPPPPATWQEILDAIDQQHEEIATRLRSVTADSLNPVQFYTAPKTMGEYKPMEFLWFMLFDQIHHRGQLSVYLRIAGGRLPSIYGPTADEPWT